MELDHSRWVCDAEIEYACYVTRVVGCQPQRMDQRVLSCSSSSVGGLPPNSVLFDLDVLNLESFLLSVSLVRLFTVFSALFPREPAVEHDQIKQTMSNLKNSPFGKRLRASHHQENDEDNHRRTRPRTNLIFGVATASTPSLDSRPTTSESGGSDATAVAKDYGDRFVPTRETGDMRTSYHLMDEVTPSTPSKTRIIPTESDALKEQANNIFASILQTEVTPMSPHRPASPTRQSSVPILPTTPTRRRLFAYNSPSNPATPTRRLDTPTDEAYSMSPVRQESRQLLESPRRQLRNVCKTPYRVLDAHELADDFYLNLVDWSSTNVLGVGLGSCVYLWTAHTAAVSKLCDLSETSDTVSSLSWVQKVRNCFWRHATNLRRC